MKYIKRDFARLLRQDQTSAEETIWQLLRGNQFMGLKFRRQHVIEGFVVDFYCYEHRLAIEVDGGIHEKRMKKEYDGLRQAEIESKGIRFIRITNKEIEENESTLFDRINEVLSGDILPSPSGRGSEKKSLSTANMWVRAKEIS